MLTPKLFPEKFKDITELLIVSEESTPNKVFLLSGEEISQMS